MQTHVIDDIEPGTMLEVRMVPQNPLGFNFRLEGRYLYPDETRPWGPLSDKAIAYLAKEERLTKILAALMPEYTERMEAEGRRHEDDPPTDPAFRARLEKALKRVKRSIRAERKRRERGFE